MGVGFVRDVTRMCGHVCSAIQRYVRTLGRNRDFGRLVKSVCSHVCTVVPGRVRSAVSFCVKNESGQATVELALCFPVMLIVAVIGFNALYFFGECASFDRVFPQAVRAYAAAPSAGSTVESICAQIRTASDSAVSEGAEAIQVIATEESSGLRKYTGTFNYTPTLFGLALKTDVFGVAFPQMKHEATLVIDPYKTGVLL